MKLRAMLVVFGSSTLLASSITVFSDFGPGRSYGGSPYNVTGSSSVMSYEAVAVPFTPSASVGLTQVDAAFEMLDPFLGGDGSITLSLLADNGGQPGANLVTWENLTIPSSSSVLTVNCSSCASLVSGTQYWLAVVPVNGNTGVGWDSNNQNVQGRVGFLMPQWFASWQVQSGWTLPAFDVLGESNSVPEPATGWLWPTMITGLYLRRRRRAA